MGTQPEAGTYALALLSIFSVHGCISLMGFADETVHIFRCIAATLPFDNESEQQISSEIYQS